jgi:hypothetical protein
LSRDSNFYTRNPTEFAFLCVNCVYLTDHDIGVSESYWRPTERELLEDYLKAVPSLSILGNSMALEKQIEELTEKSKEEV